VPVFLYPKNDAGDGPEVANRLPSHKDKIEQRCQTAADQHWAIRNVDPRALAAVSILPTSVWTALNPTRIVQVPNLRPSASCSGHSKMDVDKPATTPMTGVSSNKGSTSTSRMDTR
jgi:hypothetical protein